MPHADTLWAHKSCTWESLAHKSQHTVLKTITSAWAHVRCLHALCTLEITFHGHTHVFQWAHKSHHIMYPKNQRSAMCLLHDLWCHAHAWRSHNWLYMYLSVSTCPIVSYEQSPLTVQMYLSISTCPIVSYEQSPLTLYSVLKTSTCSIKSTMSSHHWLYNVSQCTENQHMLYKVYYEQSPLTVQCISVYWKPAHAL